MDVSNAGLGGVFSSRLMSAFVIVSSAWTQKGRLRSRGARLRQARDTRGGQPRGDAAQSRALLGHLLVVLGRHRRVLGSEELLQTHASWGG